MHVLDDLLTPDQVRQARQSLLAADWDDGRHSAGPLAARSKHNLQLAADHPLCRQLGDFILGQLGQHSGFMAAALPLKVFPPRFNRYQDGGTYGDHIDSAVFSVPGTPHRIRGDLSATLFLSDPEDYDGGELVIREPAGPRMVKLRAGQMVLYPSGRLHHVRPVTRGVRLASFFWIQSLVREEGRRDILWQLDQSIQILGRRHPEDPELAALTGVYHNLLRQWSET